ncbi:cobalt-precorrin-6A reductase [Roseibium sediminicola]|uniref:Cobalt-precorrin-6A reductase n=1 Tax=Roseibium sediminicola TaxID=2933272 RepID=A0ABT0H1L3_9HYPH|nr:cobalt-precorrin-6A reductase [Roseibium sp. CAU 1639]MCK7615571.1 cobalt-precorrin-6A reductase [Roseibium sp. CAU 1639]
MTKPDHILLLAGTFEARLLARALAEQFPAARVTASFAGVVADLPDLGVPTRVGGFGGPQGLEAYLRAEAVTVLIDATHPFAAQMSRNAAAAAAVAGTALLRLERPAWRPVEDDIWQTMASLEEAASVLPAEARVFLSVGRKDFGLFTHRSDLFGLARMIEPPSAELPDHWQLVLARPAQTADEEIALLERNRITHLVTKNSGGTRAHAKIEAARRLALPVLMVDRPALPEAETADTVEDILKRLRPLLTG